MVLPARALLSAGSLAAAGAAPPLPAPALDFSFLGYPLRLADPGALALLLLVLALAVLGAVALVRRHRALTRAAGALAGRVAPASNRTRPAARLASSLLGLALLALALARPQCGARTEVTRQHGIDLAIVLDASRSMLAKDVGPDRLARAKLELGALLDGLGGDRVGLVVFAGDAFVQCPLTSDHEAVKLFLRAADPEAFPRQGTSLARALAAARDVLLGAEGGARTKVALVVSDGEDHEGGLASAARALAQQGVRISALAVGTAAGAPVPPREGERPGRGEPVLTRLDLAALQLLAGEGGGDVYDVGSPQHGLAAFRAALDRMERSDLEGRVVVSYEDRYALAAFPGFLLLLAALLVREARGPAGGGALPGSRSRGPGGGRSAPGSPTATAPGRSTPTATADPTSIPPVRAEPGAGAPAPARSRRAPLALLGALLLGFSPFQAEEQNVRAGNERLREGDPAGAHHAYDAAERAVGPRPEIDFDRGHAALREGRLGEATDAWRRAAEAAPAPLASRALQNVGSALAASGDRDGAVQAFSDALAKDPSNEDARWNLEVLLRSRERPPPRGGEQRQASGSGEGAGEASSRPSPSEGEAPRAQPQQGARAEQRGGGGEAERAEAERQRAAEGRAGHEPLSRQEAEALLDALRGRERRMPVFGAEAGKARRQDAAKDW